MTNFSSCGDISILISFFLIGVMVALLLFECFKSLRSGDGFSRWLAQVILVIIVVEVAISGDGLIENLLWQQGLKDAIISWIGVILLVVLMSQFVAYKKDQPLGFYQPSANTGGSQTTRRILAASLLDRGIRREIIGLAERERVAMAPELGIDFSQIVNVSYLLDARKKRFDCYYLLVLMGMVVLILYGFSEPIFILLFALLFVLVTASVRLFDISALKYKFLPMLRASNFVPGQLLAKLQGIYNPEPIPDKLPSEQQNVVVHGTFNPFVGTGTPLETWSFTVDCGKSNSQLDEVTEIQEFELTELYTYLEKSVHNVDYRSLSINEYIFVNGRDIWNKREILPDPLSHPKNYIDFNEIADYIKDDNRKGRYYQWFKLYDWGNEIILSYLLHLSRQGDHLFIEMHRFLLPPLSDKYRHIDVIETESYSEIVGDIITSLFIGPLVCLWRSLVVGFSVLSLIGEDNEAQKYNEMWRDKGFNFGAQNTLRAKASNLNFDNLFQLSDIQNYTKLFDAEIMDGIRTFLEEHNIDTSEFSKRQQTILNQGVIVQGGELQADAISVGANASSSSSTSNILGKSMQTLQNYQTSLQENVLQRQPSSTG